MADPDPTSGPPGPPEPSPPRGSVVIRTQALEHVVEGALKEAADFDPLAVPLWRSDEAITVVRENGAVGVSVRVQAPYGEPAIAVGRRVRAVLRERVPALAGVRVDRVDVVISDLGAERHRAVRRPDVARMAARVLATVLAVVVLVFGLALVVDGIAIGGWDDDVIAPWSDWRDWARRTDWGAWTVRTAAAATALVGLVLLVLQLSSWRRERALLLDSDPAYDWVDWVVPARELDRTLRDRVEHVAGSRRTSVRRRRHRVRVRVRTRRRDVDAVRDLTRSTVQTELDRLRVRGLRDVRVDVRTTASDPRTKTTGRVQ